MRRNHKNHIGSPCGQSLLFLASREFLFASSERFPPKNPKTGIMWYLFHVVCFHYAKPTGKRPVGIPQKKRNDIFLSNRAKQEESDSYHFLLLFPIFYINEEKQGSEPVCQNLTAIEFLPDRSDENNRTASRCNLISNIPVQRNRNGPFQGI